MLQDITKPTVMEWNTPMEAMMTVFNMEKEVSSKFIYQLEELTVTTVCIKLFIDTNDLQTSYMTKIYGCYNQVV